MKKKEEIPCILYLYLQLKLDEKFKGNEFPLKEVSSYLHEWRIPKQLRPLVIKEFEMLGLIEKKDRNTIKIGRPEFSMEKVNEYYSKLNLFT